MGELSKNNLLMKQKMAIEICAMQPEVTNKHLAKQLGISYKKMCAWRNNPKFIERTVDRFIEVCGNEVPLVMKALIREAKEGNTRAAEIFLKQMGRLQETLTVKIEAPFTQHLKSREDAISTDDAMEMGNEIEGALIDIEFEELPERNTKNNKPIRVLNKDKEETAQAIKRAKKNADRNKRYGLRKRAEAVGLEPLKGGRPHPAKRKAWIKKLEKLEKEKVVNGE
jgi:hypothetical protein